MIPISVESAIQSKILPDLTKGRKDFDLPHTKAVVYWMKTLLSELLPSTSTLDPLVLITAAYAHDWGYIGLFDGVNSSDPAVIKTRKPQHMERGSEMIRAFLLRELSNSFTTDQINRVAHLVSMHDRVEQLKTEDEKLIMEADTLGMLDIERVKPTFSKADNDAFLENEIKNRRFPSFLHTQAIMYGQSLLQKRADYYTKEDHA